jgi:hypothetical protein
MYAGGPAPNYTDPYAYNPGTYDTDAYAAGYADGKADNPYYDTDPVQFAYTPADIPVRSPVVRPERATPFSTILHRQARQPLFELVESQRLPIHSPNPPIPSQSHLSGLVTGQSFD